MRRRCCSPVAAGALVLGLLSGGSAKGQSALASSVPAPVDNALAARASGIHQRVITLDTHVDISSRDFMFSRNYTQDLGNQVNLPKMKQGGLDACFFVVYTGQSSEADAFEPAGYQRAYDEAINAFEAIHRLTKVLAPDQIELALAAGEVRRINAKGKKVALIGIENGYPLGDETTAVRRVKEFFDRGARYLSLAHNGHSQLSDSNTGEQTGWKWHGLSPLGKEVIAEMNKWGLMIDISHPSRQSMMQTLQITKAPIIASHSGVRALADVSRNLDDEQLLALKKNGGVMQAVALGSYVKADSAERRRALDSLREEFKLPAGSYLGSRRGAAGGAGRGTLFGAAPAGGGGRGGPGRSALASLSEEQRADLQKRIADIDAKFPPPARATVKDFVDHIDYAVKMMGIDHVGISSDFGGGGGVEGWNGADETLNVTVELVRRGYTERQIGQLWSGNLLRVMDEVQQVARGLQKGVK